MADNHAYTGETKRLKSGARTSTFPPTIRVVPARPVKKSGLNVLVILVVVLFFIVVMALIPGSPVNKSLMPATPTPVIFYPRL